MTSPVISVVISTRNRREELALAIHSCRQQTLPCEIIVIDDASTDGTSAWIRQRYPQVRLVTREQPCESCINRNEGFRLAQGRYVVSLDDDSFFSATSTLQRIVDQFEAYPQAAILALAYVEPHTNGMRSMAINPVTGTPTKGFVACAAAFRMALMRQVGNYNEVLRRGGEERDLAIRVIDQNKSIIFVNTPPIIHLYSPKRNKAQIHYQCSRNTIWFCWMRIPFPECVLKAITGTLQLLIYRFSILDLGKQIFALGTGWFGAVKYWSERSPVSRGTYNRYKLLPSHGAMSMSDEDQEKYLSLISERMLEAGLPDDWQMESQHTDVRSQHK